MVRTYPNTTTKTLKDPAWELLLKRIGQPMMLHLLLHCAIFVGLPNACYLQVCGRPVNDVRQSLVNLEHQQICLVDASR